MMGLMDKPNTMPPTDTHNLIAGVLHESMLKTWSASGVNFPKYNAADHYQSWEQTVKTLCEVFPSLLDQFPVSQAHDIQVVERGADRHTHQQWAVMSPDGCIDRTTVRTKDTAAWAAANKTGLFDPSYVTGMLKVGYRLVPVRVDLAKTD